MRAMDSRLTSRERRRHTRAAIGVDVLIDGRRYRTKNISVGGFCVIDGIQWIDDGTPVVMKIRHHGILLTVRGHVRPVFYDAKHDTTGFEFLDLDPDMVAAIDGLLNAILNEAGSSSPGPHCSGAARSTTRLGGGESGDGA